MNAFRGGSPGDVSRSRSIFRRRARSNTRVDLGICERRLCGVLPVRESASTVPERRIPLFGVIFYGLQLGYVIVHDAQALECG